MRHFKMLRALDVNDRVHLAEDESGRKVVLKKLSAENADIYARIAELPQHSGLEQVYECFEQDGGTVAVCSYIEGSTLQELLQSGRTFPLSDTVRMISDLCRAVEHLHKNGIIHRDINPNNIIINEQNDIVLIDYGIARQYTGKRDQDTTVFGTEGFSAPEQYGFRETRRTADVYSIGMVLRQLLNSAADGSVTREVHLRRVAARCTAFDPDKRYGSAEAVRRALRQSGCIIAAVASVLLLAAAIVALALCKPAGSAEVNTSAATTSAVKATTSSVTTTTTALPSATTTAVKTTEATTASSTTTAATTTTTTTTATTATTAETTVTTATSAATAASATTQTTTATTAETTAVTTAKATTTTATTAATTTTTAAATVTATAPPQELHTSDMDNPDIITITTTLNEHGNHEDSFDYRFFDDPTVHGEWVGYRVIDIDVPLYELPAEQLTQSEREDTLYERLSLRDGGAADIFFANGRSVEIDCYWTNGYMIMEQTEGTVAQRMFTAVIDDVEFLFMEFKSGDYSRRGEVYCWFVYTRA